jgi:LacI family transcriptional regulator
LKKKDINSDEIARIAGVSRSTVSRVVNNYSNVPEKTRQKIMKVIQQHNYFPNVSAQVLAGKKTKTIGLFMIDTGRISGDALVNRMIVSIIEHASSQGYYVLTNIIRNTQDEESIKSVKEIFYRGRIDGGIFIGAMNHEPLVEELISERFQIGIVDQYLPGRSEENRIIVNFDNDCVHVAMDYLVSLNHKQIGMITGDMKRYSGMVKYEVYLNAMKRHGLPIEKDWIISSDFSEEGGYAATKQFLESNIPLPTAFISANDSVAFGVIRAMHEHGLHIPEDISIIGFDDHGFSARFKPALTTLRFDFDDMMQQLTSSLIHHIEKKESTFKIVTVRAELICRESCRAI